MKIIHNFSNSFLDESDTLSDFGDCSSMRTTTAKLNPLSVLNSAMKRTAPRRSFAHSSPKRGTNNNNNNVPEFTSTIIRKDKQTNRLVLSPMRKALF